MFLVGHTAFGVAMAATAGITNPVGAFAVGWLSHYLADFVPHGDESVGEWAYEKDTVKRLLMVLAVDAMLILFAVGFYVAVAGFSWWAALAAFGATIPDVMWGLEVLFKKKLFGWHEQLHHANHNAFAIRIPLWLGIPLQLIVSAALWWWVAGR